MSKPVVGNRITVIAIVLIAVAVIVVYGLFDPADTGWFPRCPWLMLTGFKCPGCGTQRALHALLHGDISLAWYYNAALVITLPLIIMLFVSGRKGRMHDILNGPRVVMLTLIFLIGWTIVRNLTGL
ncbi:MAG: DUF2752 domain-containing protein [Paramuribaculum sp.]|nr:DUF2752 domain-containing protein [Paramuribaculum sp.]MDE6304022.1 DUF2752 domain-containing protein [Paramuribaculum sp.]